MRTWLTNNVKSYNDSKELYKEVLKMPFEEDFLWHAHKNKQAVLTVENTEEPTITVEEALKTRNFTPDEEFSVLYSATLMYHIAKLRYEHRDMPMELFEKNIFPIYEKEITQKSIDGSVEITKIHRYSHKIVMPKNIHSNQDMGNFVVNVSFLYEDMLKTPLINPQTGKTYTGFDSVNYSIFSENMKKRVIQDMLQCELFNYCLECGLDNKDANHIWNTYNWLVIINTIYNMYVEEAKTLTDKT